MSLLPEDCYQQSARHLAMLIADSYCAPEAGHTGGGFNVIWRGISMMSLPEEEEHRYRRHMDALAWFHELCRLPGGGFKLMPSSPSGATRYTGEDWGISLGMTYTAPRQRLRMLGAPPTKFSVRQPLPELPWGTADGVLVRPLLASRGRVTGPSVLVGCWIDSGLRGVESRQGMADGR